MGKNWHKKKNRKTLNQERKERHLKESEEKQGRGYDILKRENKFFEMYYKEQKIVSLEEWDIFLQCLKEDLPVAFRFTCFKNHVYFLVNMMKQKFQNSIQDPDIDKSLAINPLPWYPDNLGWQLNKTRKEIRSLKPLWNFHQFLISETETGNISRQEAVSMIPPLILDINPNHKVLDMCAAPGSKTAQIIEFLHRGTNSSVPNGIVVANDSDNKRCYMLTHQAKRLQSPTLMITNHDAAFMPNIHYTNKDGVFQPMKFDRILCDVPCSGDGTLRKNFDVWAKWNAVNGANLHGLQFRIARRGLEMLDVGGRLVYSTCSLNPLENEAVVNRLLQEFDSCIELLDIKDQLPGLKASNGLENWSVMNRNLEIIKSCEDIPAENSNYIHKNLFPPTLDEKCRRKLNRCLRILPHHQNTGGFFVAVFSKLKPFPGEKVYSNNEENQLTADNLSERTSKAIKPPRKRRCQGYKEEPFFYLDETRDEWKKLQEFYGTDPTLDGSLFLSRVKDGKGKNLYLTNALVKNVVMQNEHRIKVINTGVKVFVKCENKGSLCDYRLSQEGSSVLFPFLTKRKLKVTRDDMIKMLLNEDSENPPQIINLHQETQDQCEILECGSVVFLYENDTEEEKFPVQIHIVGWKGKNSVRCYVAKTERSHFLRLLDHEPVNCDKSVSLTDQ